MQILLHISKFKPQHKVWLIEIMEFHKLSVIMVCMALHNVSLLIAATCSDKITIFTDPIFQAHGGEENIKHHPFFRDVKWRELEERKVKPPFKPKIVRKFMRLVMIYS